MFSIISTAFGYLLLLIIVVTPLGQWLLLSSAFWTAGMDIIFYFVDNDYPDKVVAFVSAIVAILFVYIVRVIWNVLPPLVDLPSDDEAVCAARPVASAAAGKYGMSHQDFLVESASSFSSSVSGSRPNHTDHEYRGPVGGGSTLVVASPNLIMPETDAVFASLSLDGLRMPEVEKKAYGKYAKNVMNASNCVSRFLPVDKQLVAVPCPAAVADALADASWRSDLAESNNVSLSSASRSTGVSDCGFVASASNATDMTKAVDADVSCSSVAGANSSGDDAGIESTPACFGAEDGVAAAVCSDDTGAGAVSDSDAFLEGGASILDAAVPSGVAACRASTASLVSPIARMSCCTIRHSGIGMKRSSDWEFALFAHQEQAKKYKVAPVCDGSLLPATMNGVATASASEPMEICPSSPVLMDLDFSSVEPMEICPPSPSLMDLASPAVKPMDLDYDNTMDYINDDSVLLVREASPMDTTADGWLSFGLLATIAFSAAANAAPTPTNTIATAAAPPTASAAAIRRCIAYPRARSALCRPVGRHVAQQQPATTRTTTTTTSTSSHVSTAATTAATIATTATTATVSATTAANDTLNTADTTASISVPTKATSTIEDDDFSGKFNEDHNNNQVENTTSATRTEIEEFDLNPADILDAKDYPEENFEYDEFEGFDFTEGLDFTDRLG